MSYTPNAFVYVHRLPNRNQVYRQCKQYPAYAGRMHNVWVEVDGKWMHWTQLTHGATDDLEEIRYYMSDEAFGTGGKRLWRRAPAEPFDISGLFSHAIPENVKLASLARSVAR